MQTDRYQILVVVLTVLLAGCGGIAGIGGPSVSNAEATVVEGQPALVFDYEVDDYAIAMLEDPDGDVVHERRIEPDQNSSALLMGDTQGGEYQLLIRQGGETVTTQSLEFEGPNLAISGVEDNWSGNSLESVNVSVENTGDLPARLEEGALEINGTRSTANFYTPVSVNKSVSVSISGAWGGTTIGNPGPVEGAVTLNTTDEQLSGDFSRVLEPASLSIEQVDPQWSGNALEGVDVSVRNTGDLPTRANVTVEHQGEEAAVAGDGILEPGELGQFEATSFFSAYEVQSGGEAQFDVYVNSPSGRVSDGFTREIAGAEVSLESIDTTWESGRLTAIRYTANNAGDVTAEYSATVEVNGETVSEGDVTISPEGVDNQVFDEGGAFSGLSYVADSGGEYEVTMTIETESGSATASDTVEFDGIDSTISEVDPMFYNNFDGTGSDFTSTSFSVRNDGDITMRYDSIEVEIGGASRTVTPYGTTELEPGSSTNEYVSLSEDITVDSGTHDLTIRLLLNGDTVASETTTVSTD